MISLLEKNGYKAFNPTIFLNLCIFALVLPFTVTFSRVPEGVVAVCPSVWPL